MKDAKEEALYCMGQMADKCLTSLGAIQKDHNDFVSLVKRMREAQNGIYQAFTTSPKEVVDWSVEKARQLESEVDELLMQMEV